MNQNCPSSARATKGKKAVETGFTMDCIYDAASHSLGVALRYGSGGICRICNKPNWCTYEDFLWGVDPFLSRIHRSQLPHARHAAQPLLRLVVALDNGSFERVRHRLPVEDGDEFASRQQLDLFAGVVGDLAMGHS